MLTRTRCESHTHSVTLASLSCACMHASHTLFTTSPTPLTPPSEKQSEGGGDRPCWLSTSDVIRVTFGGVSVPGVTMSIVLR